MHDIHIDLETYSSVPIAKAGMYKYVSSDDFEILLIGYALDDGPSQIIDLAMGETVPAWLIETLFRDDYIKHAHNAGFEFLCLSKYYGSLMPSQWRCSMMHSLYCGYPASLEMAGSALGLPADKQKLSIGKALIRYFCVPCKATRTNGYRTRNMPNTAPEKWSNFKTYCKQDVETERAIDKILMAFPVPDFIQKQWETDLIINSRGVAVDIPFVDGALAIGDSQKESLMSEAVNLTNLANPNSVKQLSGWLNREIGNNENDGDDCISSLNKEIVKRLLDRNDNSDEVTRVLEIRQELGKTSTKKYDAIKMCVCPDGRVRGLLQFYGANRTGRWAGRLVQVQNLPRTYTDPIELARELVKSQKSDSIKAIYGSIADTLSQLIRTAFIASPTHKLIDADFSAIEARVISWLAGEQWRLDVFRTHGKIYEASASQMFGVPIDRIKKGNPEYALRAKGKVAELALGYQGGKGALINMGALEMGLSEDELPDIVKRWRQANSHIQALWYEIENAAITVIENGGFIRVRCLVFAKEYSPATQKSYLTITLPSGRKLFYVSPSIGTNSFGGASIQYIGLNQTTKKWEHLETYGGKLTENCVQAIARDCLAESIERLEKAGFPIVFHVHDEVVIDITPYAEDKAMLSQVCDIMSTPMPWAPDLPLGSAGWVGDFFTKD